MAVMLVTALVGSIPTSSAATSPLSAQKVVLFAADGMRPDLMERYAAEGAMPTYRRMMETGVKGVNG
ncbi:MAG: hypothetical protein ACM3WR_12275, partial [Solirubrobacterales bacterium]